MKNTKYLLLTAALTLCLMPLSGCAKSESGTSPAKERAFNATGSFEELKEMSMTDLTLLDPKQEPAQVKDVEALTKQWDDTGKEEKKKRSEDYDFGRALFATNTSKNLMVANTSTSTQPKALNDGDTVVVSFACLSKDPDVKVGVMATDTVGTAVGGFFNCGHNKLNEGTFKIKVKKTTKFAITKYLTPHEGYYLSGAIKAD